MNNTKYVFMRARAGNIKISFGTEEEAMNWQDRIVSKLDENGYKIKLKNK